MAHLKERTVKFTSEDEFSDALNHAWERGCYVKRGDMQITLLAEPQLADAVFEELRDLPAAETEPEAGDEAE